MGEEGIEILDGAVHERFPPEEGEVASEQDIRFHQVLCEAGITTQALEGLGGCEILPPLVPEIDDVIQNEEKEYNSIITKTTLFLSFFFLLFQIFVVIHSYRSNLFSMLLAYVGFSSARDFVADFSTFIFSPWLIILGIFMWRKTRVKKMVIQAEFQTRSPNGVSSSCVIINGTTPAAAGIITHRRGTVTRITGVVFEPNWVYK